MGRTWHFSLLHCTGLLSAHSCSLAGCLWMAGLPSPTLTGPHNLVRPQT